MTNANYDFDKAETLERPRDKAWGKDWAKFEKVGDSVQGFIRDVFFRPAEGIYKDQRGFTLEYNGELTNVAVKHIDFIMSKTNGLRLGDPLKIVFESEIAPKQSGLNPTKQLGFYGTNLPENQEQKTVLELENEDRKLADQEAAKTDAEFEGIETGADSKEDDFLPEPEPTAEVEGGESTTA